ncbi:MAG: hypothetical protein PHO34_05290 [Candidatus Omnitrophica bacterium]|nr:hypothetical protein [Candidatus Omnitrophota bacterium]
MFWKSKGQAVLELAILGSIILMAFALAIKHSEIYNRQQSYIQQTFRAALKEARKLNNSASWQTTDFRRMSNVTSPMELGELQQFGASSNVLWSDGKQDVTTDESGATVKTDTESKSWFQLNRGEPQEIPARDAPYNTSETTHSGFTSTSYSTVTFQKDEANGNIVTRKSLVVTDTLGGDSDVEGTSIDLEGGLGEGGKYTSGGGTMSRQTTMQ